MIAIQKPSASLYSISTYQINFLHPIPTIKFSRIFQPHHLSFDEPLPPLPPGYSNKPPSIRHSRVIELVH